MSPTWLLVSAMIQTLNSCTDYTFASVSTTDLTIDATINCVDWTITMDIKYAEYDSNYFGVVFNTLMQGNAIIYTSGKSEEEHPTPKLYAYYINGKTSSDVQYDPSRDWEEISTVLNDGIQVKYQQELSRTAWNIHTKSIEFRYAIGNTLKLEHHKFRSAETFTLEFEDTDPGNVDIDDPLEEYHEFEYEMEHESQLSLLELLFETKWNQLLMILIIITGFVNVCVYCQIKYEMKVRKDYEIRRYYDKNEYLYNQQSEISEFNMDEGDRN